MTDKLRECPFCGGDAMLRNRCMNTQNYVVCENCGAVSKITETESDAIKAWNNRKPMDRIVEQLERLPNVNSDYWNFADLIDREDAIEIVKGGGGDEV